MAFYQFRHPWQSNYAVPEYVLGEPPGRGAYATTWLQRGTIPSKAGTRAAGAKPGAGYAQPAYVLAEPPLRGVFVTKQLPRRTVGKKMPDYLARPVRKPKKSLGSLSGSSLGDITRFGGGARQDPFSVFGDRAARAILVRLQTTVPSKRASILREILRRINLGLPRQVNRRLDQLQSAGVPPAKALHQALAENLSTGLRGEMHKLGKFGKPKGSGLVGLGAVRIRHTTAAQQLPGTEETISPEAAERPATIEKWLSLGGPTIRVVFKDETGGAMWGSQGWVGANWGDLKKKLPRLISAKVEEVVEKPYSMGSKVAAQMSLAGRFRLIKIMGDNAIFVTLIRDGKPISLEKMPSAEDLRRVNKVIVDIKPFEGGNAFTRAASSVIGEVTKVFAKGAEFIVKIVEKAAEVVEEAVDKIGELACEAVNHELAGAAAAGGSAYAGADPETGAAAVTVAQSLCQGGSDYPAPMPQKKSIIPWVALGAGALVLVWGATQ